MHLRELFGPIKNFCIDNPYCHLERAKQAKSNQLPQDTYNLLEKTEAVINEICDIIQAVHTFCFATLYEKKQEVEKRVIELLTAYDNQKKLEKAIKNAQKKVDSALKATDLKKDYKCSEPVVMTTFEEQTSKRNTLCGAKGCHSNCHTPCSTRKIYIFRNNIIKNCAAIDRDGFCKKCKHHYTEHYHTEGKYVIVTEEREFVDTNMEKKFKAAESQEEREKLLKDKLQAELKEFEDKRQQLSSKLLQVMEDLLGTSQSYTQLIEHYLPLIEARTEGATGDKSTDIIKRMEELKKKL